MTPMLNGGALVVELVATTSDFSAFARVTVELVIEACARSLQPSASTMAAIRKRAPRDAPYARTRSSAVASDAFEGANDADLVVGDKRVRLTNLRKPFFPELGITKGDLLRYYVEVSPWLLPHLRDRAMVMKRYPHGAGGPFFFMKRAPSPRPPWVRTCTIEHASGNVIDFPIVDDVATLAWIVNLGCIDLNPWYARCDDTDRPDYLHFDLDPPAETRTRPSAIAQAFETVRASAFVLRKVLEDLGMRPFVKTSGSKGLHLYVPIVRRPTQKEVWTIAKTIGVQVAAANPSLMTSEYVVAKRPKGRVLVDFNQNRWGSTLASIYSVRPTPRATVSTPMTWEELADGVMIDDFTIANVPARLRERGDLWAPMLPKAKKRFDLGKLVRR